MDRHAAADAARVNLIGEQATGGGDVGLDGGAIHVGKNEARPRPQFGQAEINLMHLELLGVVADQRRLESVAILRAESWL